ncbi:MAG: endo-1,4-beta-xylanase [Mariniblastus sp.]
MRFITLKSVVILATIIPLFCASHANLCSGQVVQNAEFDDSTKHWSEHGQCTIHITPTNYASGSACLVDNRSEYWNGLRQSIVGELVEGTDYHLIAYVRTVGEPTGAINIEIAQTDDRGRRYLATGEIEANDSGWTMIQAGFRLESVGPITELDLIFNGRPGSNALFSFIVDSVSITENNWLADANARIESIRKRDVELTFKKPNGALARNHEVTLEQIRHHFPFGSALSPVAVDDEDYREFFKQHFEYATLEWDSQWLAIEEVQGTEVYTIADALLNFSEANGIPVKGHALVWGDPLFRPTWLDALSPAQLNTELDERITNAVTRYQDCFIGWDVGNEMLNHTFFQDQLGRTIRPWMFQRAKEIDPNSKLFTNEFGLTNSQFKSQKYHAMVDSLVTAGASVSGIGVQGHFRGSASPKGIEITIDELSDLGIDIWFTEFDTVTPDAANRADSLEAFYRYAFSRPETSGIVMWGFWAGSHWLGPDASLVDLDWTINPAGQRYLDLMEEWSTNFSSNTKTAAELEFRCFHGDYLLTTTDPNTDTVNHHLIRVEPGTSPLQRTLVTSYEDQVLLIYGSESDDVFSYDMENPSKVQINATSVLIPQGFGSIQFVGLAGEDSLNVKSKTASANFYTTASSITPTGSLNRVRFSGIETVSFIAQNQSSSTTLAGSLDDDTVFSYSDSTVLLTPSVSLSVEGFKTVRSISNSGSDVAFVYDSPNNDVISYDPNSAKTTITHDTIHRTFRGFTETLVDSTAGVDIAYLYLPTGSKVIDVSPETTSLSIDDELVEFTGIPSTFLYGSDDPNGLTDNVNILGSDQAERLRIGQATTLYESTSFRKLFVGVDQISNSTDTTGNDVLLFFDSTDDDQVSVIQDATTITSASLTHSLQHFDTIRFYGTQGGQNSATLDQPSASVSLIGDWDQ